MEITSELATMISRLEQRLESIDTKLDGMSTSRRKSMEWIATMNEHVRSLDEFREEVRASFEPLLSKLRDLDEVMCIMRHATSDVARRVIELETRKAG